MRLPQASPGEGGERDNSEHWSNWEIAGGEKHFAYVAGPTQWFIAHASSRTKPCVHWMTKGAIACKLCAKEKERETVGYVPLWRGVDWRPKFVIVYGSEREHIDPLENLRRVIIGREKELGARIYVRTATCQEPAFNTTVERRRLPQDITDTLLTIWGIPELRAWCNQRPQESDNAMSQDKLRTFPAGADKLSGTNEPDAQAYTMPEPTESEELYGAVVNRVKERVSLIGAKPSTNGKPKPKG